LAEQEQEKKTVAEGDMEEVEHGSSGSSEEVEQHEPTILNATVAIQQKHKGEPITVPNNKQQEIKYQLLMQSLFWPQAVIAFFWNASVALGTSQVQGSARRESGH
jgi:hypothetical protein